MKLQESTSCYLPKTEKKSYKEAKMFKIGESDIASLCFRTWNKSEIINFGEDGEYDAYICYGDGWEIGAHYKKVADFKTRWIWIYDDRRRVEIDAGEECLFEIYRAGCYGCIISIKKL